MWKPLLVLYPMIQGVNGSKRVSSITQNLAQQTATGRKRQTLRGCPTGGDVCSLYYNQTRHLTLTVWGYTMQRSLLIQS